MKLYWAFVLFGMLVAVAIFVGMDKIKDRYRIDEPDSEIGEKIDEAIGLNQKRYYDRMRSQLTLVQAREIQTAVVLYQGKMNKDPESVKDLVDAACIQEGAMTDSFGEYYKLRRGSDGKMRLVSPGLDRVLGTEDDVVYDIQGMGGETVAAPQPTPTKSLLDMFPTPTRRWGSGRTDGAGS